MENSATESDLVTKQNAVSVMAKLSNIRASIQQIADLCGVDARIPHKFERRPSPLELATQVDEITKKLLQGLLKKDKPKEIEAPQKMAVAAVLDEEKEEADVESSLSSSEDDPLFGLVEEAAAAEENTSANIDKPKIGIHVVETERPVRHEATHSSASMRCPNPACKKQMTKDIKRAQIVCTYCGRVGEVSILEDDNY